MKLVLTALSLNIPGGMQTYMLTVVPHLERLGHEVTIYSPEVGIMADVARERGMRVTRWEHELPDHCDAVIAQDSVTLLAMLDRYRSAASLIVVHSAEYDLHLPPVIAQSAVVMNEVTRRRVEAMLRPVQVHRLRQPIDTERHFDGGALPVRPAHVLMLGNYIHGGHKDALVEACEDAGIRWRHVGLHGESLDNPIPTIAESDIVIGQGRSALDAMACGRAVWVYGPIGGDGWVTPHNYADLESDGFHGRATESAVVAESFRRDLALYDAAMGPVNRNLVVLHHSPYQHAVGLVEALDCGPRRGHDELPLRELARVIRTQYEAQSGMAALAQELQYTRRELTSLSGQHHLLATEHRSLVEENTRLTAELLATSQQDTRLAASRRWLASTFLRPIDRYLRRSRPK